MEQEKVILSFNGVVTADFLTAVLDIMENKMSNLNDSPNIKKKVFNVLVECLQNLYHHIDEEDDLKNMSKKSKSALVMVVKGMGYFLFRRAITLIK